MSSVSPSQSCRRNVHQSRFVIISISQLPLTGHPTDVNRRRIETLLFSSSLMWRLFAQHPYLLDAIIFQCLHPLRIYLNIGFFESIGQGSRQVNTGHLIVRCEYWNYLKWPWRYGRQAKHFYSVISRQYNLVKNVKCGRYSVPGLVIYKKIFQRFVRAKVLKESGKKEYKL